MFMLSLQFIDRFKTNQWFAGACKLTNYIDGDTSVKINGAEVPKSEIPKYLAKDIVTFNFQLARSPVSIRYRGMDTNPVIVTVNGTLPAPKHPGPIVFGGVTQTIWGGAATPFMVAKPTAGTVGKEALNGQITLTWPFAKQELRAGVIVGLNALSNQFKNSAAGKLAIYTDQNAPERIWSKSPITPSQISKFWPMFDDKKLGAKSGELAVFAIGLTAASFAKTEADGYFTMDSLVAQINKNGDIVKDVKITELGAGMSIKQTTSAFACSFNIFVTYDIYWNVWAVAVAGCLIFVATALIIPTKCINVREIINKKKARLDIARGTEVTEDTEHYRGSVVQETVEVADTVK